MVQKLKANKAGKIYIFALVEEKNTNSFLKTQKKGTFVENHELII